MIKNLARSLFAKRRSDKKYVSLTRDYYLYASFILAIALSSSLWLAVALYNSQKNALEDQLISGSELIDAKLSDYFNYISHIAEDKGHKIALKGNNLQDVAYLFKRNFFFPVTKQGLKRKAFIWPHFSWIDKNGYVVVKSEFGILKKPEKIKDERHLYLSTINPWQLQLSDPYHDLAQDKTFIDAFLGVSNLANDKYLGSIATRFNIEKIVESIQNDLRKNIKFIILNEELKIIIDPYNRKLDENNFFVNKITNIDFSNDFAVLKNGLKYQNNLYKIYKKSADYPFIILTGYNSNSFNYEFAIDFIKRFLAIFGSAFLIGLILFYQRQRIIKPINHLARITKNLVKGHGDTQIANFEKGNYSREIYELYQGILLTKALIDKQKENRKFLEESNLELKQQNRLVTKSTKLREEFLCQTRENIIEDTILKITKDVATILDHEQGNVIIPKKSLIDLHKKTLSSCAKILSYVSDNLNLSLVNVENLIKEAVEMAYLDAQNNQIKLITDINDKIPDISVDQRSIKHVIVALINYAMEDKKRDQKDAFVKIIAKVLTKENQQLLQIIFEDNGHGISEEMRNNFEQNSKKESNTSLSIIAIRSILSSHQASLEINSEMGKGTIMKVEIPYVKEDQNQKETFPNNDNIIQLFPRD